MLTLCLIYWEDIDDAAQEKGSNAFNDERL